MKLNSVIYLSRILKEVRIMGERLSNWRFILLWLIPFIWVVSTLISAIKG